MENTRNVTLIFLILTFFSSSAISGTINISSVVDNIQGNISRDIRIVGGNTASGNQFPHAAALFLFLTTGESFCGGSIIHANYIITAAHCLDDLIRIDVQAGTLNIFQGTPQYRATVMQRDVRQHPQYDKETLRNDIGLIYAMQPIRFSSGLQPIALPARHLVSSSFIGQIPFVIGWGRFSDSRHVLSDALQYVRLPIVNDQSCTSVYNQLFPFFNSGTNICASGSNGRSTCNGDSGGSMSITLSGRNTLIGIVSYGSATCEGGYPVVMTRVSAYLDWISNNSVLRL
ncbi:unnamed protein product [Chironomus riparius]|uniref:Peptidase S1 domain-containing protein n=1 Tax=Chironomus riparius TaxID=315576 RepID=A0A9N9RQT6_9DIPT|nr:unnamed protein product [Chironomus riparius]